jgi:hypothetical protein
MPALRLAYPTEKYKCRFDFDADLLRPAGDSMITRLRKLTRRCLLLLSAGVLCSGILAAYTTAAEPEPSNWHLVTIPEAWRKVPNGELTPVGGFSWYRCLVQVPESWKGAKLSLFMEALDDARASYVNGQNVGATGTFPPEFRSGLGEKGRYKVASDLVDFGTVNTIAIRRVARPLVGWVAERQEDSSSVCKTKT